MIAPPMMQVIRRALDARLNIMISGETSSGKTTLMRALLRECGAEQAVFIIEDTAELNLTLPCAITHETPYDPKAPVDPSVDSIYSALRSAPDIVGLGEIRRPPQLLAYLRVLSTGFRGCLTTMHAAPGQGVVNRGEEMLMETISFSNPAAYTRLMLQNIDMLIHCSSRHHAGHERRVSHLHWIDHAADNAVRELHRLEQGRIVSNGAALDLFIPYLDRING